MSSYYGSFPYISRAFQNMEAAFERCSTKVVQQNDVKKYNSSAPVVKGRKAYQTNLQKITFHQRYFSKNLTISSEYRYWKIHLHGCCWGRLCFKNIPECLLLRGSCHDIFILKVLMVTHTVFTQKSAYARKSASLELAPPFWSEIFNERLPRMSAPLFSRKRRSFEKYYLKGALIWEVHKKIL